MLARPFGTCFGFTEGEVLALLERAGRAERIEDVRAWYNGYAFGGEVIYNPWSVLSQRDAPKPGLFWIATSSNDLVRDLLQRNALRLQPVLESLLAGGSIERVLDENVVLSELGHKSWAFGSSAGGRSRETAASSRKVAQPVAFRSMT